MNLKKNVDTNLGITILLMVSSLLVIFDFIYIGNELGWDLGFNSKNDNSGSNVFVGEEELYKTEDDILLLGNEMYDRASRFSFHPEFVVLSDDNGDVKFIKSDSGEFVVTDDWQQGIFFKVVSGIDEYKNLFTENMLNKMFIYSDDEYYSDMTPSGGRGANIYYKDTILSIVLHDDNRIVYDAKSYYIDGEEVDNSVSMDDSNSEIKTNTFELIKENGIWKVNDFTLAY